MKKILLLITLLVLTTNVYAGLFGSLFGSKDTNIDKIEEQNKTTNTKLGVIESIARDLKVEAEVTAQGQAGVGNAITKMNDDNREFQLKLTKIVNDNSTNIKQISKNVNQSNQAGIFYVAMLVMGLIIGGLLYLVSMFMTKSRNHESHITSLKGDKKKYEIELDTLRKNGGIK